MRYFSSALFALASLATFAMAAPISVPAASLPTPPKGPTINLSGVANNVASTVTGEGINLRRGVKSTAADFVKSVDSKLGVREDAPSIAVIFSNLQTEILPYTTELTYLVPANCTITTVTTIVESIKAPIIAAIPQLQGLVGDEVSRIYSSVDGTVTLTVQELAGIVGALISTVLTAVSVIIPIVIQLGGDILPVLGDLVQTVLALLVVVVSLVGGILVDIVPVLQPVLGVISVLELNDWLGLVGLSALVIPGVSSS